MGCATSKPRVCRNCNAPCSPIRRSYSIHGSGVAGDVYYHTVALTSTTLGSLQLDNQNRNKNQITDEFSMGLIEAKTWSEMITEKIPKAIPRTPIETPPGEPETIINAWELMEGLEDISPLKPSQHHVRSFSFHVTPNFAPFSCDQQTTPRVRDDSAVRPTPPWGESADNDSNSTSNDTCEFDPETISEFRKALESLKSEEKHINKNRVILYFTSLRGIRKTYEDCCHVRMILKGFGVKIDERDVSMHSGFKNELKERLGDDYTGGFLPRVFLGEKCIGSVEEIQRMHEEGRLEKALEGCERITTDDSGGNGGVCESCGDIRFVPCETCSGSCKIYSEADYDYDESDQDQDDNDGDDDDDDDGGDCGFRRCPDCNENGLIRCPVCCD